MKVERKVEQNRFSRFMEDEGLTLVLTNCYDHNVHYVKAEIKELNVSMLGLFESEANLNLIERVSGKVFNRDNGDLIQVSIFWKSKEK